MVKLVAVLVCRNGGTRLFGKPLQLLDVANNVSILDVIVNNLKAIPEIDQIVLGIAYGAENLIYQKFAEKNSIEFIFGDEDNVAERYYRAAVQSNATHVFRVTAECPFVWASGVNEALISHKTNNSDVTLIWDMIDGFEFEVYGTNVVEYIFKNGDALEKEHLSLMVRNNPNLFRVNRFLPPDFLRRKDLRFTVDNPEDLIFCRNVYKYLCERQLGLTCENAVVAADENSQWKSLIEPFLVGGYAMMTNWSD